MIAAQDGGRRWKLRRIFDGPAVTVPNLLSLFRLALIPVIVRLDTAGHSAGAAAVFLLSGLTDLADGFVARHFGQISDLGKALDPLADKLTQLAAAACLARRFRYFPALLALMCVKESLVGIGCLLAIRRSGRVRSADWHGKAAAALMLSVLAAHFLWRDIPAAVSAVLIALCASGTLFSGAMYAAEDLRILRSSPRQGPER